MIDGGIFQIPGAMIRRGPVAQASAPLPGPSPGWARGGGAVHAGAHCQKDNTGEPPFPAQSKDYGMSTFPVMPSWADHQRMPGADYKSAEYVPQPKLQQSQSRPSSARGVPPRSKLSFGCAAKHNSDQTPLLATDTAVLQIPRTEDHRHHYAALPNTAGIASSPRSFCARQPQSGDYSDLS